MTEPACYLCGKEAHWGFGPPGWEPERWTCYEHRLDVSASPSTTVERRWASVETAHEAALARSWQPDAYGAHDHLTAHPYTGEPGEVVRTITREHVVRQWRAYPERHYCVLPLINGQWVTPAERAILKQDQQDQEIRAEQRRLAEEEENRRRAAEAARQERRRERPPKPPRDRGPTLL